jgi:hypothetical protein
LDEYPHAHPKGFGGRPGKDLSPEQVGLLHRLEQRREAWRKRVQIREILEDRAGQAIVNNPGYFELSGNIGVAEIGGGFK